MKDEKNVKRGKKGKASGADFEKRTRKDLEAKGWTVDKFSLNVEFGGSTIVKDDKTGFIGADFSSEIGKLVPAKHKFRGMGIPMALGTGFPDFVCFRRVCSDVSDNDKPVHLYEVIGVECKVQKYLKPEEKEKCRWYLENGIFSKILVAYKTIVKNRIVVNYEEFTLTKYTKEVIKCKKI